MKRCRLGVQTQERKRARELCVALTQAGRASLNVLLLGPKNPNHHVTMPMESISQDQVACVFWVTVPQSLSLKGAQPIHGVLHVWVNVLDYKMWANRLLSGIGALLSLSSNVCFGF